MSSSVFFKFKSQKEPSRVTFDGTGISVFELKREIISINRLGDGTDFELAVYNEDSNEGMSCKTHSFIFLGTTIS
jgi:protein MPE1